MKRSKTKLLEMTVRQGQAARAELLAADERARFFETSVRHLCDLLGVQDDDPARAVATAAERIRAMQVEGARLAAEVVRLHGELASAVVQTTVVVGLEGEAVHRAMTQANNDRAGRRGEARVTPPISGIDDPERKRALDMAHAECSVLRARLTQVREQADLALALADKPCPSCGWTRATPTVPAEVVP